MRVFTILSLFMLFLPGPALAASWCSATKLNPTERTICASSTLRRLDDQMTSAYRSAKARNKDYGQLHWLRKERDRCGTSYSCIKRQYETRITVLRNRASGYSTKGGRPWCSASRLNATERAICGSSRLSDLDATLQFSYEQAKARSKHHGQKDWLFKDRNACGGNTSCIENSYHRRISVLQSRLKPYRNVQTGGGARRCSSTKVNEYKAVCVVAALGSHACTSKLRDELGPGAFKAAGATGICDAAISKLADGSIDPGMLGISIASGFMHGMGDSMLQSESGPTQFFGVLFKIGGFIGTGAVIADCFARAERVCR